jgi:hypothetical protein
MKIPDRFREWAPRMMRDLIADFGFTDFQAAGIVGNGGGESGGFMLMQELRPTVPGSRGGLGAFQWTGPRRIEFEKWLQRKGWNAHQYEANYSFLYRELIGPEKKTVPAVKAARTLEEATLQFCKVFERPDIPHVESRIQWAKAALEIYRKAPAPIAPPKEVPVPVTTTPAPASAVPPAVPWYKSIVTTGSGAGLGASVLAVLQAYRPGVPLLNQLDTLAPPVVATFATLFALLGRVSSQAQPVTLTQSKADQIAVDRGLPTEAQSDAASLQSPVPIAYQPTAATPLDQLPLDKLAAELPRVVETIGMIIPALGMLGSVLKAAERTRQDGAGQQ